MKHRQAPKRAYVLRQVSPDPLAQFLSSHRNLPGSWRGKPLARPMRRKQRDLEHKLLLITLPAFGQRLEDLEAMAQVVDGFEVGRSLDREFASATPPFQARTSRPASVK